jgi:hypothetical protein
MSISLTRLDRWERAIEGHLGPFVRLLWRALLSLVLNFVMCLLALGMVRVLEIVTVHYFDSEPILAGVLPMHYIFNATDAGILFIYAVSIIASIFTLLRKNQQT